ncbi:type II CRISPR-associated endonuclease Cas1 [Helicobacter sp. MIT 21-1697]|uniref:type II CRISPR-associated endonuclease Cas1 n=1 Tax=Helicobacter sp. MIT 21-1697 TaxID=2993733 RepID=UPI00224B5E6F|nr:type II CRISPR-associated endonuclease Cas1 [Helicobacter sp. MIT 21-1697]MCX2716835.1 type II CRISPR-associated endonuclease Cas1 [Helicobacter sp. MIT 21-1697]
MFDAAFRTLFLSTPARLSLADKHLCIAQKDKESVRIPLVDILCVMLESHQITLTNALLNAFALHKIIVFTCNESHLPSGLFMPFLGHYRSLSVLQSQIELSKQRKAILWQQIIKAKITNQARLLQMCGLAESAQLESLAKNVQLGDSYNNEAKAAAIYFKALFGKDFSRKVQIFEDSKMGTINAALNYAYALTRGVITRSLCASGLNPALGINHKNQFNAFNLADDLIEPYRPFVDSIVVQMVEIGELGESLSLQNRVKLVDILQSAVIVENKLYPLSRAVIVNVQSVVKCVETEHLKLKLPLFCKEKSNGRKIYESASDV